MVDKEGQQSQDPASSPYALITGGSEGIGRDMSIVLAEKKINIILVALPGSELEEHAGYLATEFKVKVEHYGIDLTEAGSQAKVYEWCRSKNLPVFMLINNAGFGYDGAFEKNDLAKFRKMILLNNMAPVELTHYFIPELKKHKVSYILNVGSMASFFQVPYKAIYSASKNFIYAFSRAIREELKYDSVHVSCLCPGPTITNVDVKQRIEGQGFLVKFAQMKSDRVAKIAINGLLKNKAFIIPGLSYKFFYIITRILPKSVLYAMFTKQLKDK
ncbi:MAG: SDR family NAD(P)-dependent oxidoreductase [Bacteroidetes bacterium]|nr:SDR family NAD(P)-dependent oxidoreductase [Bacteroidota bacterium]